MLVESEGKSEECVTTKRILSYIPFSVAYLHHRMEGEEEDTFVVCECYDLRAGKQFVLHHIIAFYEHILGQGHGQLENIESQTIFKSCLPW